MTYFKNNSGDFVDQSNTVVSDPTTRLKISQGIGGDLNKLPLFGSGGGYSFTDPITPRNPGESIFDFTSRLDRSQPVPGKTVDFNNVIDNSPLINNKPGSGLKPNGPNGGLYAVDANGNIIGEKPADKYYASSQTPNLTTSFDKSSPSLGKTDKGSSSNLNFDSLYNLRTNTDQTQNGQPQDYAFISEQDFKDKTGLQDFSSVAEINQDETPTTPYYKYKGNPTVFQRSANPTSSNSSTSNNPIVGTSEAERAKARTAEIEKIKAELNAGTQAPTLYKSAEEFKKLREEQGVVKDEEELASIRNEAALGKEELRQYKATAGQGTTEGGRLGMVSEAERNLNFRQEGLAIRESAVVDRLNSKNSYISTIVNLGQQDYASANAEYIQEYNKNVKAIEMYNTELDNEQKDALTGFTTIANLLQDKNLSEIDPNLSTQLDSLALKAGLPQGLFQNVIKALPNEKILSPQVVDTATGKDVYFYTQGTDGVPHLKKIEHLTGQGTGSGDSNKLLSPTDAAKLGVPYGTTQGQAAALGINPSPDLTTEQLATFIKISDKYQADAIINLGDKAISAVEIANNVIKDPSSAGNQLQILYTLVKNLDPNSAVREGELDLASRTQSYLGKFETTLTRISKGQLISPQATLELAQATKDLAGVWSNAADRRNTKYSSQASVAGISDAWNKYIGGSSSPSGGGGTIIYKGQTFQVDANGDFDPNKPVKSGVGPGFDQAGKPQASIEKTMAAIGQYESGGNYKAIGKTTSSGDKAYGKYQVMGANIPQWTKEALGKSLTIQQFLNDPKAQDAVAKYKMGGYLAKYGTLEDVATAWFAGPGAVGKNSQAKDANNTSVPKYIANIRAIYNKV